MSGNGVSEKKGLLFGPAGNTDGSSSRNLLDLGSLFADEFYPKEMDFSKFLNDIGFADDDEVENPSTDEPTIGNVADDAFVSGQKMEEEKEDYQRQLDKQYSLKALQQHQLLLTQQKQQELSEMMNASGEAGGARRLRSGVPLQPQVTKHGVVTIPPAMPEHQPLLDQFGIPVLKNSRDEEQVSTLDENGEELDGRKRRKKPKFAPSLDPLSLTEQQKLERRERNREHAKRSRIRKKVLLDLLQDQLSVLRGENVRLRRLVQEKLPLVSSKILADCTTEESLLLFSDDEDDDVGTGVAGGNKKSPRLKRALSFQQKYGDKVGTGDPDRLSYTMHSSGEMRQSARILVEPDFRLIQALVGSQQNFVLSDPSLPDNPIVYCSDGFCKITGYKRHEIIGRNCRFLQGPGTDSAAVDVIRQGVAEGKDISVCLLNYKADRTPFWNQFFVAALRDSDGAVVNYVGVQCEVNVPQISQIKDRVKRLPIDK